MTYAMRIIVTTVAMCLTMIGMLAAPAAAEDFHCGAKRATIVGTNGPDVLKGTPGDDVIMGLAGEDEIRGLGGDDTICGGDHADLLFGGTGRDRLLGGRGDDYLAGGKGHDDIRGHSGMDALLGGAGDDRLIAGGATGMFAEDLWGGPGDDYLHGGAGENRALFVKARGNVRVNLMRGRATGEGMDRLVGITGVVGGRYDDFIVGNDASNVLIGLGGDDDLRGRASGTLDTGKADVLVGNAGDDHLDGGAGFDFVDFDRRACLPVTVDLAARSATGQGMDTLSGIEGVYGSGCNDVLIGDAGDNAFWGGFGDDSIDGGPGADTSVYLMSPARVVVDLAAGSASGGMGEDTLTRVENIWGTSFNDRLVGDDGANELRGYAGDDTLDGAGGDDVLDGNDGDDDIQGGLGHDTCRNAAKSSQCEAS